MKKLILTLVYVVLSFASYAQTVSIEEAKQARDMLANALIQAEKDIVVDAKKASKEAIKATTSPVDDVDKVAYAKAKIKKMTNLTDEFASLTPEAREAMDKEIAEAVLRVVEPFIMKDEKLSTLKKSLEEQNETIELKKTDEKQLKETYDKAIVTFEEAEKAYSKVSRELHNAEGDIFSLAKVNKLKKTLKPLEKSYQEAEANKKIAQDAYESVRTEIITLEKTKLETDEAYNVATYNYTALGINMIDMNGEHVRPVMPMVEANKAMAVYSVKVKYEYAIALATAAKFCYNQMYYNEYNEATIASEIETNLLDEGLSSFGVYYNRNESAIKELKEAKLSADNIYASAVANSN